jgi:hypothetical protein
LEALKQHVERKITEAHKKAARAPPRGESVYEYELEQLANRLWELMHPYKALIDEGRQEEAQRVADEHARVKSQIEDLARSAEGEDE